ncbi:MAG TPA: 30S ribosomal protein S20 [Aquifex aeolicus]|uniref:Small ribosomal subunit protein bS20 n=1 Tax=Aquifex aeolicus TaxID=63363 RepID=A0A9D0YP81_AQUAO|nr:30S ribosomal protein S20 [Aquificales bacterium]HIP86343.1 30S ribosomal protein S20 [Aquifex sp.]HIP97937.1 30S ribosomal protein S20 [Aquifex aeolicus]HIQ26166.1 30S ribosomal protein S20 [Aquifex aeolicus]
MANTKSAKKAARQNIRRRLRNRYHLSRMKTYIKRFRRMVEEGRLEEAKQFLPEVQSIIMHTWSKGVITKREASRRISRIYQFLNKTLKTQQEEK